MHHPSASLGTSQVCDLITHTSFILLSAVVNGVSSTNSERTVLQWYQTPNTDYPDCITSYSIVWNGMTCNIIDTATYLCDKGTIEYPGAFLEIEAGGCRSQRCQRAGEIYAPPLIKLRVCCAKSLPMLIAHAQLGVVMTCNKEPACTVS